MARSALRARTGRAQTVLKASAHASEKVRRVRAPVLKATGRGSIGISLVLKATVRASIGPAPRTARIARAPVNGQAAPMGTARVPAAIVRGSVRIARARTATVPFVPQGTAPVSVWIDPRVPPVIDPRAPKVIVRGSTARVPPVTVLAPVVSAPAPIAAAVPVRPAPFVPSLAARANRSTA